MRPDTVAPKSQRHHLHRLPPDWREEVARSLFTEDRLFFLIAAVCGARPIELARGITVRILRIPETQDPILTLAIPCAKLDARLDSEPNWYNRPPPSHTRTVTICDGCGTLVSDLEAELEWLYMTTFKHAPRKTNFRAFRANMRYLKSGIRALGTELFGVDSLSLYALRHQFASDLFDAGTPPKTIAVALGHLELATQRHYVPASRRDAPKSAGTPRLILLHASIGPTNPDAAAPVIAARPSRRPMRPRGYDRIPNFNPARSNSGRFHFYSESRSATSNLVMARTRKTKRPCLEPGPEPTI